MVELLRMSQVEVDRLQTLQRVRDRRLTRTEAARVLGITRRQVYRLMQAFETAGVAGLISKRRGRAPNNKIPAHRIEEAVELVRRHYADFGPTLACEKLAERHGVHLSVETLRKAMIEAGVWVPRRARAKRAYQPRNRRDCLGELIQVDGSEHWWFEQRGPQCTLLVFFDDATSRIQAARFCDAETTFDYFAATRAYLERHGRPLAMYTDKHTVFRPPRRDATLGDGITQFGRALDDLGVELICANSSQAKGRVERAHQTLQDRLVKELRLAGIDDVQAANAWLPGFLEDYNARFGKPARYAFDAHRPLQPHHELDEVLCWQESRKLTQALTLRYDKVLYCIEDNEANRALRGKRVQVRDYPNGRIKILYEDRELKWVHEFDKRAQITQADIVENKRLAHVLSLIKQAQDERPARRASGPVRHPAQIE
jgi:transposase